MNESSSEGRGKFAVYSGHEESQGHAYRPIARLPCVRDICYTIQTAIHDTGCTVAEVDHAGRTVLILWSEGNNKGAVWIECKTRGYTPVFIPRK